MKKILLIFGFCLFAMTGYSQEVGIRFGDALGGNVALDATFGTGASRIHADLAFGNGVGLEVLWEGSFYHLWFMPFILVVSVATFVVAKAAVGARTGWVWVLSVLCLAEALLLSWVPASMQDDSYRVIVLNALPSVFLGIAMAAPYDRLQRRVERRGGMLAGVALFAVSSILLLLELQGHVSSGAGGMFTRLGICTE